MRARPEHRRLPLLHRLIPPTGSRQFDRAHAVRRHPRALSCRFTRKPPRVREPLARRKRRRHHGCRRRRLLHRLIPPTGSRQFDRAHAVRRHPRALSCRFTRKPPWVREPLARRKRRRHHGCRRRLVSSRGATARFPSVRWDRTLAHRSASVPYCLLSAIRQGRSRRAAARMRYWQKGLPMASIVSNSGGDALRPVTTRRMSMKSLRLSHASCAAA